MPKNNTRVAVHQSDSETPGKAPHGGPRDGYFEPGGRPGPGRPKGTKDRRTLVKEELLRWWISGDRHQGPGKLKPFHERMRALANDPDPHVRATVEKHWFDQAFGKAKESVDVFHHGEIVEGAEEAMRDFWNSRGAVPGLLTPPDMVQ